MLTFYRLIVLFHCALQQFSAESPVPLLLPEAFTPFDVGLPRSLCLWEQKNRSMEGIMQLLCEISQTKQWQDSAKHMGMSKITLTFPL